MDYVQTALFEHRFWLQVLGDHARFFYTSLAPKEEEEIRGAIYFMNRFDRLLEVAKMDDAASALPDINRRAYRYANKLRAYKLSILERHLVGRISISLPPTFLNHMLNEIDEYLRILQYLCAGQIPPLQNPVHHHLLWLQDAYGHAGTITQQVDPSQKQTAAKSEAFRKQFEAYYLKAVEFAGFLRTQLTDFPALAKFNLDVGLEMKLFSEFLGEIKELRLSDEQLGILEPLLPDHMAREECYYLLKLAEVTDLETPHCDPTAPRIQA
ncbi:DUF2935 domain-containing protein [Alicyclobacillus acidoterrestris]|uniref:DUF2935 domain-containing protein n=1 Tax=Alicyclobacillus acidoterrestris (strain ATCC 49025 / DSM 3922 / CIP 106132 / NCIMB 13137 / GD3B) TaxID=1356854 RepID=T0BR26_ALIAG|nr:DUF2935 domain-containing protein [Alicyclobacillus acidoterrestris]EPZ43219.1 hypothetical protein N007_13700 [Alicyclobacillus acidoterrestris ATCC 49025]UNO48529.1 DUF2935 domain-containing protein [Alicyclobacillus acidoterrestris]